MDLMKDGHYYIKLLDKNTTRILDLCKQYESFVDEASPNYVTNEDALGQIQTTIGKAHLLINQKFKQFKGLCDKNIKDKIDTSDLKEGEFVTLDGDLAGFWDMVCLQIQDIQNMFNMLNELKQNEWILDKINTNNVVTKKVTKKPFKSTTNTNQTNAANVKSTANKTSSNLSQNDTARQAARQRLLEAKKNAALTKQKESEQEECSSNSEIFVTSKE